MNNDSSTQENSKRCPICDKVKPLTEFYFRTGLSGANYYDKKCKPCKSVYLHGLQDDRGPKTVPSVDRTIERMAEFGIYAVAGKYSAYTYIDMVAFGCVLIEVKYSSMARRQSYSFKFNDTQVKNGIKADLVVLVTDDGQMCRYSVFPANLSVFYHKDGRLKQGITYIPVPQNRKGKNYLSNELMDSYEDAWQQVFDLMPSWKERLSDYDVRILATYGHNQR